MNRSTVRASHARPGQQSARWQLNHLARQAIQLQLQYIAALGFRAAVHFELEGCYRRSDNQQTPLNYAMVNRALRQYGIEGELIPEYWQRQWEYVSQFAGQSPLKEADNLDSVLTLLPQLFAQQGIDQTLIKPVVWGGDSGQLADGCHSIFSRSMRAVHIPNAVQINISAFDRNGVNLVSLECFGEYLQQCFLMTSLDCCAIYLPEPDAFERLALKTRYGLANELCSPNDISGGHQGSIALYKELGKHNQKLGLKPLLLDRQQRVLAAEYHWQQTARIEHRLGAASVHYNAYINVLFALANLIDALEVYRRGECRQRLSGPYQAQALPVSLKDMDGQPGALSLFEHECWFGDSLDALTTKLAAVSVTEEGIAAMPALGQQIKQGYLNLINGQHSGH